MKKLFPLLISLCLVASGCQSAPATQTASPSATAAAEPPASAAPADTAGTTASPAAPAISLPQEGDEGMLSYTRVEPESGEIYTLGSIEDDPFVQLASGQYHFCTHPDGQLSFALPMGGWCVLPDASANALMLQPADEETYASEYILLSPAEAGRFSSLDPNALTAALDEATDGQLEEKALTPGDAFDVPSGKCQEVSASGLLAGTDQPLTVDMILLECEGAYYTCLVYAREEYASAMHDSALALLAHFYPAAA